MMRRHFHGHRRPPMGHVHMPPHPAMPPYVHRPFLPHGGCCGCGGCMMSVLGVGVFILMMLMYVFC